MVKEIDPTLLNDNSEYVSVRFERKCDWSELNNQLYDFLENGILRIYGFKVEMPEGNKPPVVDDNPNDLK